MYLSQEYLERHGLKVKQIFYDNYFNVILKSNNYQWLILHGYWVQHAHPSHYVFQLYRPLHNGFEKNFESSIIEPITDKSIIFFDEFDNFIDDWIKKYCKLKLRGFNAIESQEEAELACWEMFLYSHDKWLAENMDDRFFDFVIGSTTPESSIDERLDNYFNALELIQDNISLSFSLRKIKLFSQKGRYSEWLAKLLNENV